MADDPVRLEPHLHRRATTVGPKPCAVAWRHPTQRKKRGEGDARRRPCHLGARARSHCTHHRMPRPPPVAISLVPKGAALQGHLRRSPVPEARHRIPVAARRWPRCLDRAGSILVHRAAAARRLWAATAPRAHTSRRLAAQGRRACVAFGRCHIVGTVLKAPPRCLERGRHCGRP